MKLYVWGTTQYGDAGNNADFYKDWWNGLGVVLAENVEDARQMVRNATGYKRDDTVSEPVIYELDTPRVFIVFGTS